jgi:hypothetical protein
VEAIMKNFSETTAQRPPPELAAVRHDLAAARRTIRKLTSALAQAGGQELFAGDPSSLTAQLREAQLAASAHEVRLMQLQPGRALLTAVPDVNRVNEAPAADALPSVAALLYGWQEAHEIAKGPGRPLGPGPMRAQAQASLQDAGERLTRTQKSAAMLPAEHRAVFTDATKVMARHQKYQLEVLRGLDHPDHPAAIALRAWELRHPEADCVEAEAFAALDAVVAAWAAGPGHKFMPALPSSISAADRGAWVKASATQLAYRERYNVTDNSPLGAEPWATDQVAAWDEARVELARVGVDAGANERAVQVAAPARRRSLAAVLAGVS